MDSKTVNKLIRSEVWPILRERGFTRFDSRTAHRYRDAVIDVVNFQSFNSYLAESVGCTTFSFGLNLGIYFLGSDRERLIKKDPKGRLLPQEYECQFRAHVKKRSSIDGFKRKDIFFIDPSGSTAAACFKEVRFLLTELAPPWFDACGDVHRVAAWMDGATQEVEEDENGLGFGLKGHSSYNWNVLLAAVRTAAGKRVPTTEKRNSAIEAIERAIGSVFNFDTFLNTPSFAEQYALNIYELVRQLGIRNDRGNGAASRLGEMLPPSGVQRPLPNDELLTKERLNDVIRQRVWPALRKEGFSEFTDRLAHRVRDELVEVVQVVPLEPTQKKRFQLPDGLFHVGLAILWPLLLEEKPVRWNRSLAPRPKVVECHVMVWLTPQHACFSNSPSAFTSANEALESIDMQGLQWFSVFQNTASAVSFLKTDDWEIFSKYPLIGGLGSRSSARRLLYLAFLLDRLKHKSEAETLLRDAEAAIGHYPSHLQPRYRAWFDRVSTEIRSALS